MENNSYNSLTEKLIQNGILLSSSDLSNQKEQNFIEAFYGISSEPDVVNSPFAQNPIQEIEPEENIEKETNKKRINCFDTQLNINNEQTSSNSAIKTLIRFLNFKEYKAKNFSAFNLENLFYKFFPRFYKAKIAKEAMLKLNELNLDARLLLDKTIPYGESEGRYEDLVKYLNYANEIQTRLEKKF